MRSFTPKREKKIHFLCVFRTKKIMIRCVPESKEKFEFITILYVFSAKFKFANKIMRSILMVLIFFFVNEKKKPLLDIFK